MKITLLMGAILAALFVVGCSDSTATGGADAKPADTHTQTNSDTKPADTTMVAEKAKCEMCSAEVAKTDLVSHDGKMVCKACADSHKH